MTFNVDAPALGNAISADIPDIEENFAVLGPYETIWVPAEAMTALTSNGATAGTNEYATNDIMMNYLAFVKVAEKFAAFSRPMPENWNKSTILFKFFWAPGDSACTANDTVQWKAAVGALSNDDTIDTALGTGQVISDAVTAGKDADLHVTDTTPALTVGGTPALGDLLHFKISRDVGGDNMAEAAWLFGVWIQYKINEEVAEWS